MGKKTRKNVTIELIQCSSEDEVTQRVTALLNVLRNEFSKTFSVFIFFLILTTSSASGQPASLALDLGILSQIESTNRWWVVSHKGWKSGMGKYQISKIVLTDYNNYHNTNHEPWELFNPEFNEKIAIWNLKMIPKRLRFYGHALTVENYIAAWNWGIGNMNKHGVENMPRETRAFIQDYLILKKEGK